MALALLASGPAQAQTADSSKDIPLSSLNRDPLDIWSDGTLMYVLDSVDTLIYTYNISSKVLTLTSIDLHADNANPTGIWSDGETMYVVDSVDDKVYAYLLSGGARVEAKEFQLANDPAGAGRFFNHTNPRGMWGDGETLWIPNDQSPNHFNHIYAYDLRPGDGYGDGRRDLSYVTLARRLGDRGPIAPNFNTGNAAPAGIWSDGYTTWVSDSFSGRLFAYNHGSRSWLEPPPNESAPYDILGVPGNVHGIWSNGATMWVVSRIGASARLRAYTLPPRALPNDSFSPSMGNQFSTNLLNRQPILNAAYAQGFTTGNWPGGYHVNRVSLLGAKHTTRATEVRILAIDPVTNLPGQEVGRMADLDTASGPGTNDNTYRAWATGDPVLLRPDSTYFVEVRCGTGTGNCFDWRRTTDLGQVTNSTTGNWGILDGRHIPQGAGWVLAPNEPHVMSLGLKRAQAKVTLTPGRQNMKISWVHYGGATSYRVRFSSSNVLGPIVLPNTRILTHTITGLHPGTMYYLQVEPLRGGRTITNTLRTENTRQATTLPFVPTVTTGQQLLNVSWDALDSASSYTVQWKSGGEAYNETDRSAGAGAQTGYAIPDLTPGTLYTVRVVATLDNSSTITSQEATGTPSFGPVTGVQANPSTTSATELDVSWDAMPGAQSYNVLWKSAGQEYHSSRVKSGVTTTSTTITGLTADTTYTVSVRPVRSGMPTGPHSETTGTPTDFILTLEVLDTGGAIKATWSEPPSAISYYLHWKSGSQDYHDSRRQTIPLGAARSRTVTGLDPGVEHTIRVQARGNVGTVLGVVKTAEATATPTLGKVTGIKAVARISRLTLSWDDVSGADGYTVQWKQAGQEFSTERQAAGNAETHFASIPLSPEIEYTLRVRATLAGRDAATGSWSEEVSETTLAIPAISNVTATSNAAGDELTVDWDAVAGATFYIVHWKSGMQEYDLTVAGSRSSVVGSGPYIITGLSPRTAYGIRVDAYARNGLLARSEITATPFAEVPNLEVSVASATSLKVGWDTYVDTGGGVVHRYGIRWKTGEETYITYAGSWGSNSRSKFALSSATETTIDGLTTGTEYTVQVEVYDSGSTLLARSEAEPITLVDKPGYTLSKTEMTLAEGASDTFTIKLKKKPTHDVDILPTDHGRRFTAAPTSGEDYLTFTPTNWNTAQSVTVTARQDEIAWSSAEKVRVKWVVRTKDKGYKDINFPKAVKVTITDDDTAGIEVDLDPGTAGVQTTRTIDEGTPVEYTVRLKSRPASQVKVDVDPSGLHALKVHGELPGVQEKAIRFSEYNWNTPQRVTVYPGSSPIIDADRQATISHSVTSGGGYHLSAANYKGVSPSDVTLTIRDTTRDQVGFALLSPDPLKLRPGSTRVYGFVPLVKPTQAITVTLASSNTAIATIDTDPNTPGNQSTITFRTGDFDSIPVVEYTSGSTTYATGYAYPNEDSGFGLVSVSALANAGMASISITGITPAGSHYGSAALATVAAGATKIAQIGTGAGFRNWQPPQTFTLIAGDGTYYDTFTLGYPHFGELPGDRTATAGTAFTYTIPEATDPEGDDLTYTASLSDGGPLPSWLGFDPETRTFSGTPGACDAPAALEIMVTATDDGHVPTSDAVIFTLTVERTSNAPAQTPSENLPPVFNDPGCPRSIPENSPGGVNVGAPVTATDPNGDALTYIGFDGADGADFNLDPSTGQITTKDGVDYDYETKSSYTFMVIVMELDTGEGYLSGVEITINLTDVAEETTLGNANTAPSFAADVDTTLTVDENSPSGTNVGSAVTATDPDEGDTVTYSLSGTDAASFAIGGSTGQITTVANVDYNYESKSSYSLTVKASDGKLTDSIAVTVNLTDVNEAPAFAGSSATRKVAENSQAGTNVGAVVTAADPDTGDTLTYSLSGTDAASFAIGSSTGQIATVSGVTYDYEAKSSYTLKVTASDGKLTDSIAVTVNLTDVDETTTGGDGGTSDGGSDEPSNQAPAFSEGASASRSVPENSAAGTNVGSAFTATDPDSGDTVTYSLTGTDAASFDIGSSTGQITTVANVDYNYEAKSSYSLTVEASDGKQTDTIAVTVSLNDVAEAPTVSDTSAFKTHYATVGEAFSLTLPAADANSGDGGPYTYILWHKGEGKNFAVQAVNGLSFAAATRTLSGTPEAEGTWQLNYVVHDGDDNRNAAADAFRERTKLKIVVAPDGQATGDDGTGTEESKTTPANTAPSFAADVDTTLTVDENSPAGTNVGSAVTATDPDEGDTVTYSLSGTDAVSFDIGSSTGQITTKTGVTYDYESKSSYSLSVDASDGKLSDSTPVTVSLNDVNEAPAFAGASTTRKIDENSGGSVNVGAAVTATDPDDDALTYSLSGTDAASFEIGSSTGQITTKTGVIYDYESKSSYSLTVEASDGKLTDSIAVTVSLTDVNEAPAFAASSAARSVAENSAAGTNVGAAVTATDPDDDALTYSLSGTDAASFEIGSSTGQITTKSGVIYNYEAKSSYSLTVGVSDGKGGTDSVTVTVSLTDVAEAPTVSDTTQFKNHAAKVGEAFSLTLPAADANSGDGGPYEYLLWHRGAGMNFIDQAINGLSFNAATRTLSGTPTAAGVWKLSYVVHDKDSERGVEDRFRARTNLQITVAP